MRYTIKPVYDNIDNVFNIMYHTTMDIFRRKIKYAMVFLLVEKPSIWNYSIFQVDT